MSSPKFDEKPYIQDNILASTVTPKPAAPPGREHLKPGTSRPKRPLFVLFIIFFPFVIFGLLEVTLRLVHYGPDLSLFTTISLQGRTFTVMNPSVKSRYFGSVEFNPATSTDLFSVPKPPGTRRIFCLGGSTTVGYPYGYIGAFPTFLRERLQCLFPGKKIEVINLGMTATNSFTVSDLIGELEPAQPDLIVVYDGHNEFYGALGVASRESFARSRWITLLYLRLIHLKTVLLLRDVFQEIAAMLRPGTPPSSGGTMMEQLARGQLVPYGGPLYLRGLEIFKENLAAITASARRMHVPIILASQVSNLRDLPPFASAPLPSAAVVDAAEELRLVESAKGDMGKGLWNDALAQLRRAASLDSGRADLFFDVGRCEAELHRYPAAESALVKARDLDELRFRTSSDFNRAIARAADGAGVYFADMERAFRAASPDSLIGNSLILEHLHPNLRGSFLLARAYARVMQENGLVFSQEEWRSRDTVSDETIWNLRAATPVDSMIAARKTEILTSGWPFKNAYPTVPAVNPQDTLGQIVERVTRGFWSSSQAHEAAARYFEARKEYSRAGREMRAVALMAPEVTEPFKSWAMLEEQAGDFSEAEDALVRANASRPDDEITRALGDLALRRSDFPAAAAWYRRALQLAVSETARADLHYALALALLKQKDIGGANAELAEALRQNPHHSAARALVSRLRGLARGE